MENVVNTVNFIRSKGLNHIYFQTFLASLDQTITMLSSLAKFKYSSNIIQLS